MNGYSAGAVFSKKSSRRQNVNWDSLKKAEVHDPQQREAQSCIVRSLD